MEETQYHTKVNIIAVSIEVPKIELVAFFQSTIDRHRVVDERRIRARQMHFPHLLYK